ncbi:MAG: hypothetical protein COB24_08915 [Hyphomicrobiales bacterium]|nr:MAG: hypothetical protein COB24_08915 [Hyphomicrobiales bacterium]
MKRNLLGGIGRSFMGLLAFFGSAIVIVLSVVLEPLFAVKAYALLFGRTLSNYALMVFLPSASGAVFIGNKVFGSMAVTAVCVETGVHRRLYA